MREDCINFQTRTYDTGDVARFCVLDLAPEAPWRCPENCSAYVSGHVSGSIPRPEVEPEPEAPSDDIVEVLAEAEEIVAAAESEAVAEVERSEGRRKSWQFWKRSRPADDEGDEFRFSNR